MEQTFPREKRAFDKDILALGFMTW